MPAFFIALKGVAVGAANVMPGISGATLAVILRIYDRLIAAITGLTGGKNRDWRGSVLFLAPFGVGMAAGIIAGATAVSYLIGRYSFQSAGFIAGMMAGSLPFLYAQARGRVREGVASLYMYYTAAGLAAVFVIGASLFAGPPDVYFEGTIGMGGMVLLFFGGMAGAAAMIVPGVSGAMVLVLLGIYPIAMNAVNQLRVYLSDPTALELLFPVLRVVLPVGLGIIPGVLLAGRGIAWLLDNYFALTYFVIIGLVLGTIFALFNNPDTYQSGAVTPVVLITAAIAFAGGLALALLLSKKQST
jgi:putative membrane protein